MLNIITLHIRGGIMILNNFIINGMVKRERKIDTIKIE